MMNLIVLIWNLLRGALPCANSPAPVYGRRFPGGSIPGGIIGLAHDQRNFIGWIQAAPEHPLCVRPPCQPGTDPRSAKAGGLALRRRF